MTTFQELRSVPRTLFFYLAGVLYLCSPATIHAETPSDPLQQLRTASGDTRPLATALLDALERQSKPDIKTSIKALMAHGDLDLVLSVLSDYRYFVAQEAATAVSEVKTKKVAQALLRCYKRLEGARLGGAEVQLRQEETRCVVQAALEKVTESKVEDTLELPQKVVFFEKAIQAMPN